MPEGPLGNERKGLIGIRAVANISNFEFPECSSSKRLIDGLKYYHLVRLASVFIDSV